jgi:hypothetical protein
MVLPPPGLALRPFTATIPCCFANTIVSARPPFTSAYLIDCGRFSGPDAAFRLLQRVFNYDTRAHTRERCPRALEGHALQALPCTMRSSRCPRHPLFDAKMVRARCTAASYANSPTPGLEIRTLKAVTFTPLSDTFQVGPRDMGNAQVEGTERR